MRKFFTTPTDKGFTPQLIFWFSLSLTFAVLFGLLGLKEAFSSEYVIQDDAQQHVFWMQRFLDPELFPNDLIADYYQSVAQPGYAAIYRLAAVVGIDPISFSKLLPIVLGLIATGYCFGIAMQILPVPTAGFIATLLLNQNLWLKDDLVSGTARAFLYPLFLTFLYYLLRRSLLPCLAAIALLGLIYPTPVLIGSGILVLRLLRWEQGRLRLSRKRSDYLFCAAGLGVVLLVLLPVLLESSEYGSTITAAQAKTMTEFSEEGRTRFFVNNPIEFWFYAGRSGLFPLEWSTLPYFYFPLMLCIGLLLPLLLCYPSRFPLVRHINRNINILPQIALASLTLFLAAHALLFKLYLPSRYTQYSIRILMALTAGIALTVILDGIFHACSQGTHRRFEVKQLLALASTGLLGVTLISYPLALKSKEGFSIIGPLAYKRGQFPELYEFFQEQPKDILIASLAREANQLPSFTKRSILVSREHSIPYHTGYYAQMRQRAIDLINAQYSPDLNQVKGFIQKYGVDFWLLDRAYLLTPYVNKNEDEINSTDIWIRQFPATAEAHSGSEQGIVPALSSVVERCSVFEAEELVVLAATCIMEAPRE
ncbi:hypothetical protein IQ257_02845 [Coleofasciculus sp. LEGE 07092]|nr:hypothetical protein [Coleofasciculus sp. LEGE 07081]MBE9147468.1 hypothetical protein [Coleofasciculus sp. LEGE 07092]